MRDNNTATAIPIPFVFDVFEKKERGLWVKEHALLPKNGQLFRTVETT